MELPIFDLERAAQVSDKDFAKMLDGNTRFVGNLSKFAGDNPDRWRSIRSLRGKVGESREQRGERHRRESVMHPPTRPLTPEQEIELASAIQAYPREKCRELFATGGSDKLSPEEYRVAKLSAQHFNIVGKNSDGSSVRFNYPVYPKPEGQTATTDETPAGVSRAADGIGYVVTDQAAYDGWKRLQEARKIIAEASKVQ